MRSVNLVAFLCSMCLTYPVAAQTVEPKLRVVVTGLDESGSSVIVSDGAPDLVLRAGPDSFMGDLWKSDSLPTTNQDGYAPQAYALEPRGAGGVSFRISSIPPQSAEQKSSKPKAADAEFGLHQTDTIDFITIISGEVYAYMDSGQEVLLKPGDTFVQRGTNHAWINRSDIPCVFSAVMVKPAIATLEKKGVH